MQLGRCPICHHRLSLEAMAEDEAGRQLLTLLSRTPADTAVALVRYLGLFRSASRDLSSSRAHRLASEVMQLEAEPQQLAWAMEQVVERMHQKREQGQGGRPLANHNYLKRVLEDAPQPAQTEAAKTVAAPAAPLVSATAKSMAAIMED